MGKVTRQGESLGRAAATAFSAIRDAHPEERFYFFALYTTPEGSYVAATAWSEEALSKIIARYAERDPGRSVEVLARNLRFSAPDSPYHQTRPDLFSGVRACRALHEACFEALEGLDRGGFFGRGAARRGVILNVVYGDMSDERWLAHARRLNPASVAESALPFLRLNVPSGAVSRWGKSAYQVNALSLSRDRSVVAYSGSGGEVGVLRVGDRTAIYEKRRRGEHWTSALSPDGTLLYLGDADGVGRLEWLAAAAETRGKCTLACYDAATGAPRWTASVGDGRDATAAWSPDGGAVFGAASTWTYAPDGDATGVASLASFSSERGDPLQTVPWSSGIDAVAVSPRGERLAVCSMTAIVVLDRSGTELARGTGGQEHLIACAFVDDDTVLAVGRDVNCGPAMLALSVARGPGSSASRHTPHSTPAERSGRAGRKPPLPRTVVR
jgi:hypothetical protein